MVSKCHTMPCTLRLESRRTFVQVHEGKKKALVEKVNVSIAVVMSDIYLRLLWEIKSQKETLHSNNDLKQKRQGEEEKKNKKRGSPHTLARVEEIQFY